MPSMTEKLKNPLWIRQAYGLTASKKGDPVRCLHHVLDFLKLFKKSTGNQVYVEIQLNFIIQISVWTTDDFMTHWPKML